MRGPSTIPNAPNKGKPPSTPTSMIIGCIFALSPIITGLSRLSIPPIIKKPYANKIAPFIQPLLSRPVSINIIDPGTQMIAVPIKGIREKNAIKIPHSSGDGSPKIQNPMAPTAP